VYVSGSNGTHRGSPGRGKMILPSCCFAIGQVGTMRRPNVARYTSVNRFKSNNSFTIQVVGGGNEMERDRMAVKASPGDIHVAVVVSDSSALTRWEEGKEGRMAT